MYKYPCINISGKAVLCFPLSNKLRKPSSTSPLVHPITLVAGEGYLENPRITENTETLEILSMFHFPSGKPITAKPSNKYQYNRKTRQAIAIAKAQKLKQVLKLSLLDLDLDELDFLLNSC
jgi:hypothetical protein